MIFTERLGDEMNTLGTRLRLTTAGESHGPAMIAILDGMPPGFSIDLAAAQKVLDTRRPASSIYTSPRKESDTLILLSGVLDGVTTGSPIAIQILNKDMRSTDYSAIKDQFRPGHADYTYFKKYGIRDYRGGGRSSARETVLRVAAGAIVQQYLKEKHNIEIKACVEAIGNIRAEAHDFTQAKKNPFCFADESKCGELATLFADLMDVGDSIGAQVCVKAENVPLGVGEPIYRKITAELAAAFMGINAVKGVSIGDGFSVVSQRGSEHRDEMTPDGFKTNHSGGVLGGISTGEPLICHIAFKPASSIRVPGESVNEAGEAVTVVTEGRHDPCVAIRGVAVCEAMMALVLLDLMLS